MAETRTPPVPTISATSEEGKITTHSQYIAGKLRQEKRTEIITPAAEKRAKARKDIEQAKARHQAAKSKRDELLRQQKEAREAGKAPDPQLEDDIKAAKDSVRTLRKEKNRAWRDRSTLGERAKANVRLIGAIGHVAAGEMIEPLAKLVRARRVEDVLRENAGLSVDSRGAAALAARILPGKLSQIQRESINEHHKALENLAIQDGKTVEVAQFGEHIIQELTESSPLRVQIAEQLISRDTFAEIKRIAQLPEEQEEAARQKLVEKFKANLASYAKEHPEDVVAQEFFGTYATKDEMQTTADELVKMCLELGPQALDDMDKLQKAFAQKQLVLEKAHKGSGYFEQQYSVKRSLLEQGSRTIRLAAVGAAATGLIANPFTAVPLLGIMTTGVTTFVTTQLKTRYDRGLALMDQTRREILQDTTAGLYNHQQSENLLMKIWGDIDLTAEQSDFDRKVWRLGGRRALIASALSFVFSAGGHEVIGGALGHAGEAIHHGAHNAAVSLPDNGITVNTVTPQQGVSLDALNGTGGGSDVQNTLVAGEIRQAVEHAIQSTPGHVLNQDQLRQILDHAWPGHDNEVGQAIANAVGGNGGSTPPTIPQGAIDSILKALHLHTEPTVSIGSGDVPHVTPETVLHDLAGFAKDGKDPQSLQVDWTNLQSDITSLHDPQITHDFNIFSDHLAHGTATPADLARLQHDVEILQIQPTVHSINTDLTQFQDAMHHHDFIAQHSALGQLQHDINALPDSPTKTDLLSQLHQIQQSWPDKFPTAQDLEHLHHDLAKLLPGYHEDPTNHAAGAVHGAVPTHPEGGTGGHMDISNHLHESLPAHGDEAYGMNDQIVHVQGGFGLKLNPYDVHGYTANIIYHTDASGHTIAFEIHKGTTITDVGQNVNVKDQIIYVDGQREVVSMHDVANIFGVHSGNLEHAYNMGIHESTDFFHYKGELQEFRFGILKDHNTIWDMGRVRGTADMQHTGFEQFMQHFKPPAGGGEDIEKYTGAAAGWDNVSDRIADAIQAIQDNPDVQSTAIRVTAIFIGLVGVARGHRDWTENVEGRRHLAHIGIGVGATTAIGLLTATGPIFPVAFVGGYALGTALARLPLGRVGNFGRNLGNMFNPPPGNGGAPQAQQGQPGGPGGPGGGAQGQAQQGGGQPGGPGGATPPQAGTYNTPPAAIQAGQAVAQNPNNRNMGNLAQQLGAANPNVPQRQLQQQVQNAANAARTVAANQGLNQRVQQQQPLPYAEAAAALLNNPNAQLDLTNADNARAMAAVMLPNGTEAQQNAAADAIRRAAIVQHERMQGGNAMERALRRMNTEVDAQNSQAQNPRATEELASRQAIALRYGYMPQRAVPPIPQGNPPVLPPVNAVESNVQRAINQAFRVVNPNATPATRAVVAVATHPTYGMYTQNYLDQNPVVRQLVTTRRVQDALQEARLRLSGNRPSSPQEISAVVQSLNEAYGSVRDLGTNDTERRVAIVGALGAAGASFAQRVETTIQLSTDNEKAANAASLITPLITGNPPNQYRRANPEELAQVVRSLKDNGVDAQIIQDNLHNILGPGGQGTNANTYRHYQEAVVEALLDNSQDALSRIQIGLNELGQNPPASDIARAIVDMSRALIDSGIVVTSQDIREALRNYQQLRAVDRQNIIAGLLSTLPAQIPLTDRVQIALGATGVEQQNNPTLTSTQREIIARAGHALLAYNAAYPQNQIPDISHEIQRAFQLDPREIGEITAQSVYLLTHPPHGTTQMPVSDAVQQSLHLFVDPQIDTPGLLEVVSKIAQVQQLTPQERQTVIGNMNQLLSSLERKVVFYATFTQASNPNVSATIKEVLANTHFIQQQTSDEFIGVVKGLRAAGIDTRQIGDELRNYYTNKNISLTTRQSWAEDVLNGTNPETAIAVLVAAPNGTWAEVQSVVQALESHSISADEIRRAMQLLRYTDSERADIAKAYLTQALVSVQQLATNANKTAVDSAVRRVTPSITSALAAAGVSTPITGLVRPIIEQALEQALQAKNIPLNAVATAIN